MEVLKKKSELMISFSLVDVKDITSNMTRSSFPEADLDRIAQMILDCEGIIRPLVLKLTGQRVAVDGHFEYYAAVRAREKILVKVKWSMPL